MKPEFRHLPAPSSRALPSSCAALAGEIGYGRATVVTAHATVVTAPATAATAPGKRNKVFGFELGSSPWDHATRNPEPRTLN
jgi:hypothetical protein